MTAPVIDVRDLHKSYGDVVAVAGLTLQVEQGEVLALLGPNGAGKSTTVEILEGHRERDRGEVSVLGMDPATAGTELRDRIGIVLQSSGIERELTVREAIEVYGACYRHRRPTAELLDLVGLTEKADARVKTLSGGQQRRIDLALGIVGDPEVLFLDEPTTGFDPAARRRSWELVERLRELGTTIVLTTHYMDEAQYLADRVAMIVEGKIVLVGSPEELGGSIGGTTVRFVLPERVEAADVALAVQVELASAPGGAMAFTTDEPTAALHRLTGWAMANGHELFDLEVVRPKLEDVYLQLVGDQ